MSIEDFGWSFSHYHPLPRTAPQSCAANGFAPAIPPPSPSAFHFAQRLNFPFLYQS
jgi:hypothetical protein